MSGDELKPICNPEEDEAHFDPLVFYELMRITVKCYHDGLTHDRSAMNE